MKNLIAKLKSADYKQVAINHGEKLVAGLLGLMLERATYHTLGTDQVARTIMKQRQIPRSFHEVGADPQRAPKVSSCQLAIPSPQE